MGRAQWKHDIAQAIWKQVAGDDEDGWMPAEAYATAAAMMEHVPFDDADDADDYVQRAIERGQLKVSLRDDVFEWHVVPARDNPPWRPIGVEAGGRYQTYYRDGRKSWAFEDGVLASDWAKEIKGRVEDRGPGGYTHYGRQNPSKTATQMLASLRQQRDVSIASNRDGYQLLVAGRGNDNRNNRIYIGTDLDELIRRAYNGEPGDINANPVGDRVDVMKGPGRGRSGVVESETKHVARVRFDRGGGAGHLERSALRTRGRSRD